MRKKHSVVVICDNIRSTHNVGSIFRTSDGAGVDRIYLCGITPVPPRPDIDKVSLGAEKTVPFVYKKSIVRTVHELRKKKYRIIILENNIPNAIRYDLLQPETNYALVLGSEVGGVDPRIIRTADTSIYIPMKGTKESLNVSVAFGIVIYSLTRSK